jgi:thiamine biosynthesis lipoprotein
MSPWSASLLDADDSGDVDRFGHEAMATVFEVLAAHPDRAYARQAAHAAFERLDRLEQELSRFVPNSDVSRINALAAGGVTRVSPSTMECLAIARHALETTDGAFDVALGSGLEQLELVPDELTVRAGRDGIRLDLGGIGKGCAVDEMARVLEDWGVERALVHGGWSSVVALEPPARLPGWPLRLSAPAARTSGAAVVARLEARQLALSASGTAKGSHILDPRTGRAAPAGAVWLTLPRSAAGGHAPAAVAETLSTAFMLLPAGRIEALCRENPGLEVWRLTPGSPAVVHLGAFSR